MSTTTLTSIRDWLRREDGESSFLVLLLVLVNVLVGFGLSVDWAGKDLASEEAVTIALQAARSGANAGVQAAAAEGEEVQLDRAEAARAAQQFLAQSGATGTVRTTNTKVTVDVTVEYHPKFIPVGVLTGQGTGTSSISQNTI